MPQHIRGGGPLYGMPNLSQPPPGHAGSLPIIMEENVVYVGQVRFYLCNPYCYFISMLLRDETADVGWLSS